MTDDARFSAIVMDASVAVRMIGNEEVPATLTELVKTIGRYDIVVPALWRWEVANGIQVMLRVRPDRHTDIRDNLLDFSRFALEIDEPATQYAWTSTLAIASRTGLTVYDAAYLELALRRGLPLATLDDPLAEAARAEGVEVIGS
jgi:predicted nucleic acid-binding protein